MPTLDAAMPVLLDVAAGRLVIEDRQVDLRPKTWEVLRVLAGRAGKLVTKDELLDAVWADTAVTEGTLSKSIGELRVALGDDAASPRWIETVPRRGFRWIGRARIVERSARSDAPSAAPADVEATPVVAGTGVAILARDAELARLDEALARARAGTRQIVFVSGEAGAGKTLLADSFLERVSDSEQAGDVLVAHGQCLETSGTAEPFLPFLDALERLVRDRRFGATVAQILGRTAPSWVARMPSLAAAGGASAATSPGSMLRELAGALEGIAAHGPLVLVIEDAHWSDLASTDALVAIAKRRDPARLLVLVTTRNAEAVVSGHPLVELRRELVAGGTAAEVALEPFSAAAIAEYVSSRCPGLDARGGIATADGIAAADGIATADGIAHWLLAQTAGNPLFVRLVVDDWIARGLVMRRSDGSWQPVAGVDAIRATVPDSFRSLLEAQIQALAPEERTVAQAASVRAGEFGADEIAAAAGLTPAEVDTICDRIARRGRILRHCGMAVAADGNPVERYAFLHATVQNVVCHGMARSRRRRLHAAAAEQLETAHAGRLAPAASQLAVHHEEAGDFARAIRWLREAAREAMHRDAPRDAVVGLERALRLIDATPQLPDPDAERLLVLADLTHARQLAFGFGDPQVAELWSRTAELADSAEELRDRVIASSGGIVYACVTGRYADAHETMRSIVPAAEQLVDPGAKKLLAFAIGNVLYRTGATAPTIEVFESAIATAHETDPVPGADLDALLLSQFAPALAVRGRPDDVRVHTSRALERAKSHSHYAECVTGSLAAWSLGLLYDFAAGAPIAERTIALADEYGFIDWKSRPLFVLSMARFREGRIDEALGSIRECVEGRRTTGHWVDQSAMCCLYAEALIESGREGARELLDEAAAFVASHGEMFFESEILRLEGRLAAGSGDVASAETLARRALELAHVRGNFWHALLAATDLATRLVEREAHDDAKAVLAPAFAAVQGGAGLAVVQRAADMLACASGIATP
jgi:DNA-binding winged helix-turn-helix (wHTH) protein/tetratricopeptide (TPR) repeat protein